MKQQISRKRVFREKALEGLASPEQLDQLLELTTPKEWVALIGLGSLLMIGILWSIFGSISSTVTAQGVLTRAGGLNPVESPVSGRIRDIQVKAGDQITDGQVVAGVEQDSEGTNVTKNVTSLVPGRVLTVMAAKGGVVSPGVPLLLVEPTNKKLEFVTYLPLGKASDIRPGMKARIAFSTGEKEEGNTIPGVVRSVASYPATHEEMKRMLGTDDLVKVFPTSGSLIEIVVEPIPGSTMVNGHKPDFTNPLVDLAAGAHGSVTIILSEQSPISQMFPRRAR